MAAPSCDIHEALPFTTVPNDLRDEERIAFLLLLIALEHQLLSEIDREAGVVIQDVIAATRDGRLDIHAIASLRPKIERELRRLAGNLGNRMHHALVEAAQSGRTAFEQKAHEELGFTFAVMGLWAVNAVNETAQQIFELGSRGYPLLQSVTQATTKAGQNIMADLTVAAINGEDAAGLPARIRQRLLGATSLERAQKETQFDSLYQSLDATIKTEMSAASEQVKTVLSDQTPAKALGFFYRLHPDHPKPDICDQYANNFYPMDDEEHTPPVHRGCCLPDTKILPIGFLNAFRGWYDGQAVECFLAGGERLAITENHFLLTQRGFIPAKCLRNGDYLLRYNRQKRMTTADDDIDWKPARVADTFLALAENSGMTTRKVPVAAKDFHGDGMAFNGKVNIVGAKSALMLDDHSGTFQPIGQNDLAFGRPILPVKFTEQGNLAAMLRALAFTSDSIMGGRGHAYACRTRHFSEGQDLGFNLRSQANPGLTKRFGDNRTTDSDSFGDELNRVFVPTIETGDGGHIQSNHSLRREQSHGLRLGANCHSVLDKTVTNGAGANIETFCNSIERFAGLVTLCRVVDVNYFHYVGHVYDFQSDSTLYIANNIVSSNCICFREISFKE